MAVQKIYLKRIKTDLAIKSSSFRVPDYEGFFRGSNGDFAVVGWLKPLSSDLDLTFSKIDDEYLKNKFNLAKYQEWRFLQKNS